MTIWAPMDIDAPGLASLVRHAKESTIIVDCRCFADFNLCHVKSAINAFFAKLMRKRLIENKLADSVLIEQLASAYQDDRMHTEKLDIVLYSDEEKAPKCTLKRRIASTNSPDNPSKILKVLREQLINTNKFKNIMILEGGFKGFQTAFPQLCEGNSDMARLQSSLSQPCLAKIPDPDGDGPTQIFPFLYLGSQHDALDQESMKKLGISYVVNLSMTCPKVVDDEHFLRIPVNDGYQDKLTPHFEPAWEFLERVRKSGNTALIHCLAGISRSPTLAISYVMRHKKLSSDEAYRFVKNKRPTISPNFNFMGQLLEYEQQLITRDILPAEASSKKHSNGPLTEKQQEDSCYKVPKSASSHCVMMPAYEPESISSFRLNENGKRGMELFSDAPAPDRPRALGLGMLKPKRVLPEDLPSPSSELSKLTFAQAVAQAHHQPELPSPAAVELTYPISLANPCFQSPGSPAEPSEVLPGPSRSTTEQSNPSFFNRMNFFSRKQRPYSNTSRPDCLQSAGVQLPPTGSRTSTLKSPSLLTTKEEDDAESPESGFQDEFKSTPDEPDRVSLSSQSSMEIAVQ